MHFFPITELQAKSSSLEMGRNKQILILYVLGKANKVIGLKKIVPKTPYNNFNMSVL